MSILFIRLLRDVDAGSLKPWERILFKKPTFTQEVKKWHVIYGNISLINQSLGPVIWCINPIDLSNFL
jgi:hypothetical protein